MAASDEKDELEILKAFEDIVISPHKVKYMNPRFVKITAKMYDYLCDIKLCVGGSSFKAHREVLSEASDYFGAMFSHNMLEKDQPVIELKELSPAGFTQLLDYFYHGHLTLTPDCVEDILEAARFFTVDFVVEVCMDFMVHQLSIDNYQTVLMLADKYQLGDLSGEIFRYLGVNVVQLSKEPDFYTCFDRVLLIEFLRGDVYVQANEEFVLEFIWSWVEAKQEERQEYLLPLLRMVKFPLMDPESLNGLNPEILQWPEVEDAVAEARHYVNDIPGQALCRGQQFKPRGAKPAVMMFNFSLDICEVKYMDIETGSRFHEELRPTGHESKMDSASIAKVGNFLYRSGGYNDDMCSSGYVFRYSPHFGHWTELAPMSQPRVSHAMCASEDKIFVLGGIEHTIGENGDEDRILSSVEEYDVKTNSWKVLTEQSTGSYNQAAAYSDNCLYLSGGISSDPFDSVPMTAMWCYDIKEEAWRMKKDMLYSRQGHSMTHLDGKFYILGGYTRGTAKEIFSDCYNTELYDIETNQWTELMAVPETFGHVMRSVGLWNRTMFMFGGGHLHCYHIDENRMEFGEHFGISTQKIALLDVAFPT